MHIPRTRRLLILFILLSLLAGFLGWQALRQMNETPQLPAEAPTGGDFTLESNSGPVSLHDFRGKLVMLYFGYTYCPDICPTNLGNLSVAWRQLPEWARDTVQILFISVDPERDSPARLKTYVDFFNAGIIGLTGDPKTLKEIAHRYGVVYQKVPMRDSAVGYLVDHSAFTYVIGPDGQLLTQLPHGTPPQQFRQSMLQFLEMFKEEITP